MVSTFTGNAAEASVAANAIQTSSATNQIVVILAALLTGNIDPSWLSVISMIVPEPQVRNFNGFVNGLGGWSAIGVPQTAGTPGPVGHLNAGRADYYGVQHPIGDLSGYMQIFPGYSWAFGDVGPPFHENPHASVSRRDHVQLHPH